MHLLRSYALSLPAFALAVILLYVTTAHAILEDFSGPLNGTVVAGTKPGGGTAPGTLFPLMTISVTNTGGGPQTCIIFDSNHPEPVADCEDLGSPNGTCGGGGPGVGVGGQVGQPGENCRRLDNLLIVAENIDDPNADGRVDIPDDEAGGGIITIDFDLPVMVIRVGILDIDNETCSVECFLGATPKGTANALDLGNNSYQDIDLSNHGMVDRIVVTFSSSGAVAEILFDSVVPTEQSTWGSIKSLYED